MALQPIDRRKGKQFATTASRKTPKLVVRNDKKLLPAITSRHDPAYQRWNRWL